MDEIRLGTIGSGLIVRTMLDNVARTDGIRLVAVYSRREDTGRALASEYRAKRVYTDMDAFLADERMNFVYIASPNLLHYEQAKKGCWPGRTSSAKSPSTPRRVRRGNC